MSQQRKKLPRKSNLRRLIERLEQTEPGDNTVPSEPVDATGDSTPSQPPPARGRGELLPPGGGDRGGARAGDTINMRPLSRQPTRKARRPALTQPTPSRTPQPSAATQSWWLGLLRRVAWVSMAILCLGALLFGGSLITYFWIAGQLPAAEDLPARSLKFETTQILDNQGNVLWEIIDPTGGRRTNVTLKQISPHLIEATLATEDRFFYLNVGVDPIAIVRATYSNLTERQIVSGGSTITQQLARNVFLTPEERSEKSFARKLREAVLAVEINRRYTKDQILEIYFNQIYYGNLAYGIEAAAQTYFDKSAHDLTLPEASLLAGLPQSPALHDPYVNPERAKARQRDVLNLMVEAGYLTPVEADEAAVAPLTFRELRFPLEAPHFVTLVRQELERSVPPDYIYQVGLRVHTTLDPQLQSIAEAAVEKQVKALAGQNVSNGALVTLDAGSGHILALVGSADFRSEGIDGQVNMVASPRQPGSTIKPLTYLATFERLDWTPSTLLMDVPVEYPDAERVYRPTNVDHQFHGPVTLRTALANSYNIPAVKALEAVGIGTLKETAARLGITTLTEDYYGLSLTLGSGEVSLLEMTGAYQALANGGRLVKPTTIAKITDSFGREIEPFRPTPRQVVRPEHAYLLTHILADNEARRPAFGLDSPLHLDRPAAAKTGTTNDFRDNWTIGYTPDLVTGVWVGNADNEAMLDVGGITGAAPIWHDFMTQAHADRPPHDFRRPRTIVEMEICADSGTRPGELCPERRMEIFFEEQPPPGPEEDLHQWVEIDLNTGLRANEFCRGNVEARPYFVLPPEARAWAIEQGIDQPPTRLCPSADIIARISYPQDNVSIRGLVALEGSAVARDLDFYHLELGQGTKPKAFEAIQVPTEQLRDNDLLGTFDTTQLENGPYTLRLVVFDKTGGYGTAQVRVLVDNPPERIDLRTPVTTPPPTPTPTLTPTVTLTPTGSLTATVAPLNIPPQSPAETPTPSFVGPF